MVILSLLECELILGHQVRRRVHWGRPSQAIQTLHSWAVSCTAREFVAVFGGFTVVTKFAGMDAVRSGGCTGMVLAAGASCRPNFDRYPPHAAAQFRSVLDKEFVIIPTPGGTTVDQFKAIQIQLSFEGTQSRLSKVQRDNFFEEFVWFVNGKRTTVGNEANDIGPSRCLHFQQQTVQFFGKWFNNTTPHPPGPIPVKEGVR